jgi:hypothetical protein
MNYKDKHPGIVLTGWIRMYGIEELEGQIATHFSYILHLERVLDLERWISVHHRCNRSDF